MYGYKKVRVMSYITINVEGKVKVENKVKVKILVINKSNLRTHVKDKKQEGIKFFGQVKKNTQIPNMSAIGQIRSPSMPITFGR